MKKLIILFFVCLSGCTSQTNGYEKIVIKYVDFEIMTPFDIGCDTFESFFDDELKTIEINDKSTLNRFSTFINSLKEDPEKYYPDVRLMVKLFNNNKIDTLCMSNFGISFNGKSMILSNELMSFIKSVKKIGS